MCTPLDNEDLPHGNPYLGELLKDLEAHPLDTELRRMIADTYEDELDDVFTANVWRHHASILETSLKFQLKPEHAQRIRDMLQIGPRRDIGTAVWVLWSSPSHPPIKCTRGIEVGILWLIENGMCNPE